MQQPPFPAQGMVCEQERDSTSWGKTMGASKKLQEGQPTARKNGKQGHALDMPEGRTTRSGQCAKKVREGELVAALDGKQGQATKIVQEGQPAMAKQGLQRSITRAFALFSQDPPMMESVQSKPALGAHSKPTKRPIARKEKIEGHAHVIQEEHKPITRRKSKGGNLPPARKHEMPFSPSPHTLDEKPPSPFIQEGASKEDTIDSIQPTSTSNYNGSDVESESKSSDLKSKDEIKASTKSSTTINNGSKITVCQQVHAFSWSPCLHTNVQVTVCPFSHSPHTLDEKPPSPFIQEGASKEETDNSIEPTSTKDGACDSIDSTSASEYKCDDVESESESSDLKPKDVLKASAESSATINNATSTTLPYEEVTLDDGRVVRQCRADPYCAHRNKNFGKRLRMENHLKTHGIHMQVPYLKTGRPKKGEEREKRDDVDLQLNQRRRRFYMKERKLRLAKEAKEERSEIRAENIWDKELTSEQKTKESSREEFIEKSVKTAMTMYEINKGLREKLVEARIDKGYEQQRRKKPCIKDLENEIDALTPDSKREDELEAPIEDKVVQETRREKLPIQRGPIATTEGTMAAPISINSPIGNTPPLSEWTFNVHNGFVEINQVGGSPMKTRHMANRRLQPKVNLQFKSIISKLMATVEKQAIDGIANGAEASSETMNLFGMWMENTIPLDELQRIYFVDALWYPYVDGKANDQSVDNLLSSIDVANRMFIFFPIVAMRSLSKSCSDPQLSLDLGMPDFEVDMKIVQGPQQPNGHDCGYYVMAYCFYLIGEGLLGTLDSAKWLIEDWFLHLHVEELRKDLHAWCIRSMGL